MWEKGSPGIGCVISFITWNLCVQWCGPVTIRLSLVRGGTSLIKGTNILASQQGKLSLIRSQDEDPGTGLFWPYQWAPSASPHLCGSTRWMTTSFSNTVPLWLQIYHTPVCLLSVSESFSFPSLKVLVFSGVSSSNLFPYSMKSLWNFPSTFIASIAPTKRWPISLLNSNLVNTTSGNAFLTLHSL